MPRKKKIVQNGMANWSWKLWNHNIWTIVIQIPHKGELFDENWNCKKLKESIENVVANWAWKLWYNYFGSIMTMVTEIHKTQGV